MAKEVLNEIDELVCSHTNRHVDEWKAAGKPVVGYFCRYVPAELMLAVGALPLRLRAVGSEDSASGDAYLSGRLCTYVRHVMSLVLDGHYDFLDGIVCSNSCDHVRRAADIFNKKTDIGFKGFLSIPRAPRESLYSYYLEELRNLYDGMASVFGVEAIDDSLQKAIVLLNKVRRRLIEINSLRLPDKPKLSGAEALSIHIASQVLPPEVFLEISDHWLTALKTRQGLESKRGRLILIGAELDEPDYVKAIESQGALVVADQLCFGSRSVLEPLDENAEDPLDTIGRSYFFRSSCARMMGDFPKRWGELQQLIAESRADGVIFERLMFCDPWGGDLHNINTRTKGGREFPFLALTREYGIVPTGQIKTRIQAFIEKLEIARAQRTARGEGQ